MTDTVTFATKCFTLGTKITKILQNGNYCVLLKSRISQNEINFG